MSNFFTSPPERSDDIKLHDDEGFLKNPLTGGNEWFHASDSAGTIFTNKFLETSSRPFLGTYHTADPSETLDKTYVHANRIRMKNPLVLANHHDDNDTDMDDTTQRFSRGQFLTVGQLVRHYAKKYGASVLPKYGDPNDPDAERIFYEGQRQRNETKRKEYEEKVRKLQEGRSDDPWAIVDEEDPSANYLPPEPTYERKQFSRDYLANFTQHERLHVVREGLKRDGYDGAIFHYTSNQNPTIFVIDPERQIVPQRVETVSNHTEKSKLVPVTPLENGLAPYIRRNDLFEAEKARGAESRAS